MSMYQMMTALKAHFGKSYTTEMCKSRFSALSRGIDFEQVIEELYNQTFASEV